ncbi:hypothetical protein SAMN05661096_03346 [Marivirga sericea]|uniref:Pirin N-terminal domain-containing protein n=1 Tax=Marivirga sericea TaxID=1028 RepID=A0A1X7KZL1_9BACT|nr:pirin family protein [Marivirga sericea]SMG47058.1 hypothetical protein SAMN05661096_03346 [Marivirga sericea]
MKTRLIKRQDRRIDKNSWRTAWHEYYPGMTNFGKLTGFNLDIVSPAQGFPEHAHRDMEIITLPTEGAQEHKDSLGNSKTVASGEIQVMSAGSGIRHSEMNAAADKPFTSYQIWIYPNQNNLQPSYQQRSYSPAEAGTQLLVSPDGKDDSLVIHQNAWLSFANFAAGSAESYQLRGSATGVYIQVIKGKIKISEHELLAEDSIEIESDHKIEIEFLQDSQLIIIESDL